MPDDEISRLQSEIRLRYGCDSVLESTQRVVVTLAGRRLFKGDVHTFSLTGHRWARRCFAWESQYPDGGRESQTVVATRVSHSPDAVIRARVIPAELARARERRANLVSIAYGALLGAVALAYGDTWLFVWVGLGGLGALLLLRPWRRWGRRNEDRVQAQARVFE